MTQTTRQQLGAETITKLEAYLSTGLDGFRQQAYDRASVLGIKVSGLGADQASAQALLDTMRHSGW